jgi:two-component system chemotaxis response regulator CheB
VTSDDARHVRQRDIIVIGASAGGVEALGELVGQLPPELPAAVLVVLHVSATATSVLPEILSRSGQLPAAAAADGDQIERGQIYVAPNDCHMLVHDGRISLSRGPRENGHRPAIDPLFRSAARAYRDRVVGVVLSGMLDDGAAGLRFIKDMGGATVVQDPDDAMFGAMPRAALEVAQPDRVVPVAALGGVLEALLDVSLPVDDPPSLDEPDLVELDPTATALVGGPPSGLTCPECGGTLWESRTGEPARFTCHVGHAYSAKSLVEAQGQSLESSLWAALRALEERSDLLRRLGRRTCGGAHERLETRAREADEHATRLRDLLLAAGRLAPVGD